MEQNNAIKMLAALAHEGRLLLFRHLVQAGPEGVAAGGLVRFAGVGASTVSAQLLVLVNAGLVRSCRAGRAVVYQAEYQKMSGLLGFLMEDCCGHNQAICEPLIDKGFMKKGCC